MKKHIVIKLLLVGGCAFIISCVDDWSRGNPVHGPGRTAAQNDDLFGVLYANGLYVVTGEMENSAENGRDSGLVATSPSDSFFWTSRPSGTTNTLYGAAYGDSVFATVGTNGIVLTSQDGNTWTTRISATVPNLNGIIFADGQFVTVGNRGTILTSVDGISWTIRSSGTTELLNSVAFGGNKFVAVGYGSDISSSA